MLIGELGMRLKFDERDSVIGTFKVPWEKEV
jgi:hypothetical protein